MTLIKKVYEKITNKKAPYYYDYNIWTIISKPIRKWLVNVVAPNCPFNIFRIYIYYADLI